MDIYEEIDKVGEADISEVLDAVLRRYMHLFPDWEIGTFSLCKSDDRNMQIDRTIAFLQNMKASC